MQKIQTFEVFCFLPVLPATKQKAIHSKQKRELTLKEQKTKTKSLQPSLYPPNLELKSGILQELLTVQTKPTTNIQARERERDRETEGET